MDPREAIRARLDFKGLVERYVALRPAGKGRWKGLCPFHKEKTPSFHVDEEKGLFYCFGCKAGGDAFSFLERIEGITFQEALEKLAQETGVELPRLERRGKPRRELLEINELALAYFRSHLEGRARAYLKQRGLTEASIERFALGYAPPGWDGLLRHLQKHGVDPRQGVEAGLLVERNGRVFDRFRDRVIFPIHDPLDRVVAFTGRVLNPEDTPKYLNTPETPIFKKSELLYGYAQARAALRERRQAVVVEGLFDVIALHQMGWTETVAVLGSALSNDQALLLKRAGVERVYLAFDADEAGRKATLAGLDLEIAKRFLVYAARLPEGRDPGDLLVDPNGAQVFQEALAQALSEVEFRFEAASEGLDLTRPEAKRRVLQALLPRMVQAEPFDPVAEALKALLIDRLAIDPRALEDVILTHKKRRRPEALTAEQVRGMTPAARGPRDKTLLLELDIIAQLLSAPPEELRGWVQYVEDHTWPPPDSFLAEFIEVARSVHFSPERILHHFEKRGEGARLFERLMLASGPIPNLAESLDKSMARLREAYLTARLERLKAELKQNPADPIGLLKEIQEVQKAIEAERRLYKRP